MRDVTVTELLVTDTSKTRHGPTDRMITLSLTTKKENKGKDRHLY